MATQGEQIKELTASLSEVDAQLRILIERVINLQKDVERCGLRIDELMVKVATLEERCRSFEKFSDRGWNFGQAAIISIISIIGGSLLTLLIQLAIKK